VNSVLSRGFNEIGKIWKIALLKGEELAFREETKTGLLREGE